MSPKLTSGIPATARLIEKQLKKWEVTRDRNLPPAAEPPQVRDFVCVSRMVGIDDTVAAAVAGALDWPVFSRELLEAMAGDDPVRRRLYDYMDQRDLTWWDETVLAVMDREYTTNDYFRRLCETVLSLVRKGHAVFVGRGADLILPRDAGLRVRLVSSPASRAESLARSLGIDVEEAGHRMRETEHERAEFLQHHFQVQAEDPLRHDLLVNLDRWSTEEAVRLILEARTLRAAHAGRLPHP